MAKHTNRNEKPLDFISDFAAKVRRRRLCQVLAGRVAPAEEAKGAKGSSQAPRKAVKASGR